MRSRGFSLSDWQEQAKQSKNFESFKVYILDVYNENERFVKIGRTFTSIEQRFSGCENLPYCYNIIHVEEDNPYRIYKIEAKLKRMFKQYKYKPLIKFSGSTESFSQEIIPLIKEYIDGNIKRD